MAMSKKMIKGLRKDVGPIATALDTQERKLSEETPKSPQAPDVARLLMYRLLDSHATALKQGLEFLEKIETDIAENPAFVEKAVNWLLTSLPRESLLQFGFQVDTLEMGPNGLTYNGDPIGPKPESKPFVVPGWDGNVH